MVVVTAVLALTGAVMAALGVALALAAAVRTLVVLERYQQFGENVTAEAAATEMLCRHGAKVRWADDTPALHHARYDPETIHLSRAHREARSASAVAVALHEAGHALQHQGSGIPHRIHRFWGVMFSSRLGWFKLGPLAVGVSVVAGMALLYVAVLPDLVALKRALTIVFYILTALSVPALTAKVYVEHDATRRALSFAGEKGVVYAGRVLWPAFRAYLWRFVAYLGLVMFVVCTQQI